MLQADDMQRLVLIPTLLLDWHQLDPQAAEEFCVVAPLRIVHAVSLRDRLPCFGLLSFLRARFLLHLIVLVGVVFLA